MAFLIRRQTQAHFLKKHFIGINICNSKCFCRVALTKVLKKGKDASGSVQDQINKDVTNSKSTVHFTAIASISELHLNYKKNTKTAKLEVKLQRGILTKSQLVQPYLNPIPPPISGLCISWAILRNPNCPLPTIHIINSPINVNSTHVHIIISFVIVMGMNWAVFIILQIFDISTGHFVVFFTIINFGSPTRPHLLSHYPLLRFQIPNLPTTNRNIIQIRIPDILFINITPFFPRIATFIRRDLGFRWSKEEWSPPMSPNLTLGRR
ncbi:hypothetical protein H5410_017432 [Solanum commersonii]|uniref:Uncharacterized protein n=1 Tax=Solanum commersonii TaxID=4109 RepID=A0A9J5ZZF1_SOLCO|nr:hypothetical protein H5410_017432 [Solanum commersonii]